MKKDRKELVARRLIYLSIIYNRLPLKPEYASFLERRRSICQNYDNRCYFFLIILIRKKTLFNSNHTHICILYWWNCYWIWCTPDKNVTQRNWIQLTLFHGNLCLGANCENTESCIALGLRFFTIWRLLCQ